MKYLSFLLISLLISTALVGMECKRKRSGSGSHSLLCRHVVKMQSCGDKKTATASEKPLQYETKRFIAEENLTTSQGFVEIGMH